MFCQQFEYFVHVLHAIEYIFLFDFLALPCLVRDALNPLLIHRLFVFLALASAGRAIAHQVWLDVFVAAWNHEASDGDHQRREVQGWLHSIWV